jgi:hypothetical protein
VRKAHVCVCVRAFLLASSVRLHAHARAVSMTTAGGALAPAPRVPLRAVVSAALEMASGYAVQALWYGTVPLVLSFGLAATGLRWRDTLSLLRIPLAS